MTIYKETLQSHNARLQELIDLANTLPDAETSYDWCPNGTKWTQSNITSEFIYSVYNANGIWTACGNGLYYSTDGKSWTQSNITSGNFTCVYNANGIWVAGGASVNGLYYSTSA